MESLVSGDDLSAYLQRDLDRSSAELTLAAASGAVRAYCRWNISEETTTMVLDGTGSVMLSLPTLRLTDVYQIRVDGVGLDSDEYHWSRTGMISRRFIWPDRLGCVAVDVTHGWPLDAMPDSVRAVVLGIAARCFANPHALTASTVGGTSRTFDLTPVDMQIVAGHRLP